MSNPSYVRGHTWSFSDVLKLFILFLLSLAVIRCKSLQGWPRATHPSRVTFQGWPRATHPSRVTFQGWPQATHPSRMTFQGWPQATHPSRVTFQGWPQASHPSRVTFEGWPRVTGCKIGFENNMMVTLVLFGVNFFFFFFFFLTSHRRHHFQILIHMWVRFHMLEIITQSMNNSICSECYAQLL